ALGSADVLSWSVPLLLRSRTDTRKILHAVKLGSGSRGAAPPLQDTPSGGRSRLAPVPGGLARRLLLITAMRSRETPLTGTAIEIATRLAGCWCTSSGGRALVALPPGSRRAFSPLDTAAPRSGRDPS